MGGECFESTCFYVVPFVDGNDEIQTLKATGVARITSFGASDPPHDIERRFPLAKGWARTNDLIGTIKLSEALIATTTDRATVDSGEGTYDKIR